MPVGRKLTKEEKDRLSALPRDGEAVLQGTLRLVEVATLPSGITPTLAIWVDGHGEMLASRLLDLAVDFDEQIRIALGLVVKALLGPVNPDDEDTAPGTTPLGVLPGRIQTDTPELVRPLRSMMQPFAVPVELVETLPTVDAVATETAEFFAGIFETPPQPFAWEIDVALLPPLFRAAKALYNREPWMQFDDHPPIMLELGEHGPEPGVETLFASVLGSGGMLEGVALYYSAEGMHRAMQFSAQREEAGDDEDEPELTGDIQSLIDNIEQLAAERPVTPRDVGKLLGEALAKAGEQQDEAIETEDALVLYFEEREDSNPSYLEWLKHQRITSLPAEYVPTFMRMAPHGQARPPDAREVRTLTLALRTLEQFVRQLPRDLDRVLTDSDEEEPDRLVKLVEVTEGGQQIGVRVSFPPPEDVWPEEWLDEGEVDEGRELDPEDPPSATGPTTLYRFRVTFENADPSIWRRIELRGDQTLHDLHEGIQEAFGWDDDHLYSFFLSGKVWDTDSEYSSPYAEDGENAATYRLERLPLQPKKKMRYIFDFGDELTHTVVLEAIVPGGVRPAATYPLITERHGENVPQYPLLEDDMTMLDADDDHEDGEDGEDEEDDELTDAGEDDGAR